MCYNGPMVTKQSKKPLIIANWKMNPATGKEAIQLFKSIKKDTIKNRKIELVIAPPAVFLSLLKKEKGLVLGGQDMSAQDIGACTGDIAGSMLRDAGAQYVILGHSERRASGETSEQVSLKVLRAIKLGLVPVVCVGENVRDTTGQFFIDVKEQLRASITGLPKSMLSKIVIAYEPVWAIGKNAPRSATVAEAQEMILFIRKVLAEIAGSKKILDTKVVYGASVDEKNAYSLFHDTGADGLLVGRVSLDAKRFVKMIQQVSLSVIK